MKSRIYWLFVLWISNAYGVVGAEQPATALENLLVPPQALVENRKQIGLTDQQIQQIRQHVEQIGSQNIEHEKRLHHAMGDLAKLLSADRIDEAAALKQLDEVLQFEKEQKRTHLRLMIQIRNLLTSEQRQVILRLQAQSKSNDNIEERLKSKLSRIQTEIQSRADTGQPPFEVVGIMQKFPELMRKGQVQAAEALLDQVFKALDLKEDATGKHDRNNRSSRLANRIRKIQERAQKLQRNGQDVSEIQELMQQIAPLLQRGKTKEAEELIDKTLELTNQKELQSSLYKKPELLSPGKLRQQVASLKKENVSWRRIKWNTCLLEGLKASREQNKPVMLWIFIDRPIDDERC